MEEIYTNIYKDSRKRAGLEQSEAADMIGVSYHSLAKYALHFREELTVNSFTIIFMRPEQIVKRSDV